MIDDDFSPQRIQLRAMGLLLDLANKYPETPAITESDFYERLGVIAKPISRPEWIEELVKHRLITFRLFSSYYGGKWREQEPRVSITPAGSFYAISRSFTFMENARTPTDDFPDEIIETPYALRSYYSLSDSDSIPASDREVALDHNSRQYRETIDTLDKVTSALSSDNVIGAEHPEFRDRKLEELQEIKDLLSKDKGSRSRIAMIGWGALGYLFTEFADHPVGELAHLAWEALKKLIGI